MRHLQAYQEKIDRKKFAIISTLNRRMPATHLQIKILCLILFLCTELFAFPLWAKATSNPGQPTYNSTFSKEATTSLPFEGESITLGQEADKQNQNFNAEEVLIAKPQLKALISIRQDLNPYSIDADSSRNIGLDEVMKVALSNNLDIGIAQTRVQKSQSKYLGSLGKFLPDMTMGYSYNYLKGDINMPFGPSTPTKLDTPFIIASAGFKYHGYQGGSIVFGALQQRNLFRASKHAKTTSINDILLESAKRYYHLVEAEAVLQIQIRAVDISTEQLNISKKLKLAGSATALDVFQSQTQLSQDKQDLINQQIERRRASIALSELLNLDQSTDFSPEDIRIRKIRLIDDRNINKLLSLAVLYRPELKELKERSLAAQKSIMVASGSLQPSLTFSGTSYGIGTRTNSLNKLNSLALGINWTLNSLGTSSISEMRTAQCDLKETKLQLKKAFNTVSKEVRNAFLEVARSERDLEEANNQVASSVEELRVAKLRYENGLVKKIDVLRAQNDFTKSLIKKARAIVSFNIAQAELLHNVGMINSGYLLATKQVPII